MPLNGNSKRQQCPKDLAHNRLSVLRDIFILGHAGQWALVLQYLRRFTTAFLFLSSYHHLTHPACAGPSLDLGYGRGAFFPVISPS
jgi:hypothetical protein